MKLLCLTCDFMIYKDYKIGLKFVFPICRINLRIQHITCSFINHRITIHHEIFLKSFLCEFYRCIFLQSLIIYFLINGLLLSKFIQTCNTDGGIRAKNNLLIPLDGVFDSFFKFFLCFHTISTRYTFLQVLAVTSCSFIISFCNPKQVTKIFLVFFLHLKKSIIIIIIITQHITLLVYCVGVFTLFNICLRMIIFTLFVGRINL